MVFLRWSGGMRRADGEGLREGSDKSRVVISHASHDYVRAADDGKRTW